MLKKYKLKKSVAIRLTNETKWDIRQLLYVCYEQITNQNITNKCVIVGNGSAFDNVVFKRCIIYMIDDESIGFNFDTCHFEDCKLRKSTSTEQQERLIAEYVIKNDTLQ